MADPWTPLTMAKLPFNNHFQSVLKETEITEKQHRVILDRSNILCVGGGLGGTYQPLFIYIYVV